MKKLLLSVLMLTFVFSFSVAPRQVSAWKTSCDCDGNGVYDHYDHGFWWFTRTSCNGAGGLCGGTSSATFYRVAAHTPVSAAEAQPFTFSQSVADFNSGLSSLISSYNPSTFSNLTRNTPNNANVNNIINTLYGLGFYPSMPTQKDPFGPTAVAATKTFQGAFGLTPSGSVGSAEISSLQNFSSSLAQASLTLPTGVNNFIVVLPNKSALSFDSVNGVFKMPTHTVPVTRNNIGTVFPQIGGGTGPVNMPMFCPAGSELGGTTGWSYNCQTPEACSYMWSAGCLVQ